MYQWKCVNKVSKAGVEYTSLKKLLWVLNNKHVSSDARARVIMLVRWFAFKENKFLTKQIFAVINFALGFIVWFSL